LEHLTLKLTLPVTRTTKLSDDTADAMLCPICPEACSCDGQSELTFKSLKKKKENFSSRKRTKSNNKSSKDKKRVRIGGNRALLY